LRTDAIAEYAKCFEQSLTLQLINKLLWFGKKLKNLVVIHASSQLETGRTNG